LIRRGMIAAIAARPRDARHHGPEYPPLLGFRLVPASLETSPVSETRSPLRLTHPWCAPYAPGNSSWQPRNVRDRRTTPRRPSRPAGGAARGTDGPEEVHHPRDPALRDPLARRPGDRPRGVHDHPRGDRHRFPLRTRPEALARGRRPDRRPARPLPA